MRWIRKTPRLLKPEIKPLNQEMLMPMLAETFKALNKESQFTKEMLGSGATQIRKNAKTGTGYFLTSILFI